MDLASYISLIALVQNLRSKYWTANIVSKGKIVHVCFNPHCFCTLKGDYGFM